MIAAQVVIIIEVEHSAQQAREAREEWVFEARNRAAIQSSGRASLQLEWTSSELENLHIEKEDLFRT